MQRFFVAPEVIQGNIAYLSGNISKQLFSVLRQTPGQQITLLDNSGAAYLATIESCSSKETICHISKSWQPDTEPETRITLFQAIPKNQRMDIVLQKATEVGVSAFVPLICEHSVVKIDARSNKIERWQRIVQEAAEQSSRAKIPQVREPLLFTDAVNSYDQAQIIMPCLSENAKPLSSVTLEENLSVFIGPEGGFSSKEIAAAQERGAHLVSLGKRILRSETAGIITSALALYQRGELG